MKKKINLIITEEKIALKYCIEKLKESAMEIINYKKRDMIPLTQEENNRQNEQEICYICKEKFCVDKDDKDSINRKKIKDHCHYTGEFKGPAHSICNLKYKVPKEILIIIHNATYDSVYNKSISNRI